MYGIHSEKYLGVLKFSVCLAVLCLASLGRSWGEATMIYPVPTVTGTELKSPDQMLEFYSQVGRGHYIPLQLKEYQEKRVERFETSFEEYAPGRNSAANEWSAFGVRGGTRDINCMGRDMWVRYPGFELVFRLYKDGREVKPDTLDSFRLGLVNNRLPAIWGSWQDNGLSYKVSVMTVPSPDNGNYDLYKLEIQNPTDKPITSSLVAEVDGPPDLRFADGVVRGLGDAAFVIADQSAEADLFLRDYGLCDKRARSTRLVLREGWDKAMETCRYGMDGLPVTYRFKAKTGEKYCVFLASPSNYDARYNFPEPKEIGDQIFEYQTEGCPPRKIDHIQFLRQCGKPINEAPPLCARFDGAKDENGDGYIEVRSGVAAESKLRLSILSMIYVFPEGTKIESDKSVYTGAMNSQCTYRIDVGATPEQDWKNQYYNAGDVGVARLKLNYNGVVAPGQIQTYWLKVPPIYRKESVSMGFIAHAFREILPGEAIPPFGNDKVAALKKADPKADERRTVKYWDDFFAGAARFDVPDPILTDIFLSRLATRAILDVKINDRVWYNACSPFFYFDFSYRDHCYSVISRDMAGMHEEAAKLADTYCMDAGDIKEKGPVWFMDKPLELGMQEDGQWLTRPGQFDTQGQNLWGLVEHYKLSGDRDWLEKRAYPYIRRGAMWIVNSRHNHMKEIGDPSDSRYGLIQPGAMEVARYKKGVHLYYMDAFAVLGLREAADAAAALDKKDDAEMFRQEYLDLRACLYKSFQKTFKRTGLYQGYMWYGTESAEEAEKQGGGMYGDWAHNALVWPCGAIDPQDPLWVATVRHMEYDAQTSGAGMQPGWPYISVDRGVSYLLRGEPDRTLDIFCTYTDTAGGTFSWGEGYFDKDINLTNGDQPHNWADIYWVILFRNLFAFEDGDNLLLTPATFRRWQLGDKPIAVAGLPTYFGVLDLKIQPSPDGKAIDYTFSVTPRGDQDKRPLEKIILSPRTATGCAIRDVQVDGKPIRSFTRDQIILTNPQRKQMTKVHVNIVYP
jgi:hypothetical protein